jgi:hypothetical protein
VEHGKPAFGLDHCFGDPRFLEPVAEVIAAWWRGIAATALKLKERVLPPACLSEERSADQLTAGLQAARELSHCGLWVLEHVKAAVAENEIRLTVVEWQGAHVGNGELDLAQGASLCAPFGALQHLLRRVHGGVAHVLVGSKGAQRNAAAARYVDDPCSVLRSAYCVHARVQHRRVDSPHHTTDQTHQPFTLDVEVIHGAKRSSAHVWRAGCSIGRCIVEQGCD